MAWTGYDRFVYSWEGADTTGAVTSGVWRLDVTTLAASAWFNVRSVSTAVVFAAADESGGKLPYTHTFAHYPIY